MIKGYDQTRERVMLTRLFKLSGLIRDFLPARNALDMILSMLKWMEEFPEQKLIGL